MKLSDVLERLKPERWRRVASLPLKQRVVLWKQTAPDNPALRAVVDLLGEVMEQNANVMMDIGREPAVRLEAGSAAGVARALLFAIEDEWFTAREELETERQKATK